MKKIFISLIIITLVALTSLTVFASCFNNSDDLKIALDEEDRDRYDELFEYYTSVTGKNIRATYGQDISKLIGTKDEPDIIKTSTVVVTSMKGILKDLTSYVEKDPDISPDMYIDSVMDALTIDGKIYALPTSVNTSLLYYNKTLFDASANELRAALGLSATDSVYPQADWTWDDFAAAGRVLTVKENGSSSYKQFGASTEFRWWGEWLVYVYQMGGTFYQEGSNNTKLAITSPEAIAATQFFVDKSMGDDGVKFAPNSFEMEGGVSFTAQNVAMILGGHTGEWHGYNKLGLNWDVQVLPTPVGRPDARGGEISADAFGISARSKKADDAYQFLKLWAGVEGAKQMYKFDKIGALKNMRQIIEELPAEDQKSINIDAVFDAMDKAIVLPNEENFSLVAKTRVMGKLQNLFLPAGQRGHESDVVKVLTEIKTDVDRYYEGLK